MTPCLAAPRHFPASLSTKWASSRLRGCGSPPEAVYTMDVRVYIYLYGRRLLSVVWLYLLVLIASVSIATVRLIKEVL